MIAVGGVIGAGLFVGSTAFLKQTGFLIIPLYTIAILLMVGQMRVLADMTASKPQAGSFIGQIRDALGARSGFIAGWGYVLYWCATAGSEIIAIGPLFTQLTGLPGALGMAILVALTLLTNLISARAYARGEAALSLTKLGSLVLFILVGVLSWLWPSFVGTHTSNVGVTTASLIPAGIGTALAALPLLIQTLTGFEIATVAAMESPDPVRSVSHAAKKLVPQVGFLHVASLALVLTIVPITALQAGHSPFTTALDHMGIAVGARVLTAIVLVAVTSCLNSALFAASRVLYELAETGDAPAHCRTLTASGVPVWAVLYTAILECLVAGLGILSPHDGYIMALSLSAMLIMFTYLFANAAQWQRLSGPAEGSLVARRGLAGIVFAGFALTLLSIAFTATGRQDFLLSIGTMLCLWLVSCLTHRK
ncbi:GABA permease [Neokomagataea thailandica NBRC 106555]|nr:GABA permease [Neokomagataea thailandica NBRC 106555]